MERDEHLVWCKRRALEYLDVGETQQAFTSMYSDLRKHPGTENHIGCQLGIVMLMAGKLNQPEEIRHWIEGFN